MCGVVGVIGSREAAKEAFLGLTTLQHRGQDAAGILTYDSEGFHQVKNLGLVDSVFTRQSMESLTGEVAIGHARYSTIGRGDLMDVQPFVLSYPYGIGLVHNGNLVNFKSLKDRLKVESRRQLLTRSDSEVILHILADGIAKSLPKQSKTNGSTKASALTCYEDLAFEHLKNAVSKIHQEVTGAYSVIAAVADQGLVAFRDPNGIRPLVLGKKRTDQGISYMVASESIALTFNHYEIERDLKPGELVFIDSLGNLQSEVIGKKNQKRHCMFEWVYFASAESVVDDVPVYRARMELGKHLGKLVRERFKKLGVQPDLVAPVPDTSRTSALSLAEELGVPYREVLIKNRYIKRTFILASEDRRQKEVNLKMSPVYSEIKDKKIVLVDDSIVRGTTSRRLIELVRRAGAKEVYFVSTCPPIQNPCYYGIDFPSGFELVAHQRNIEKIEMELGADALIYMDQAGLQNSISIAGEGKVKNPCMACLNGKYPTDVRLGKTLAQERVKDRNIRREIEHVAHPL